MGFNTDETECFLYFNNNILSHNQLVSFKVLV